MSVQSTEIREKRLDFIVKCCYGSEKTIERLYSYCRNHGYSMRKQTFMKDMDILFKTRRLKRRRCDDDKFRIFINKFV